MLGGARPSRRRGRRAPDDPLRARAVRSERLRAPPRRSSGGRPGDRVDRDWFIHPESFARLRGLVLDDADGVPPRESAPTGYVARGAPRPRRRAPTSACSPSSCRPSTPRASSRADRDKVRLASHEVRLSPEQQRVVDLVEEEFLPRRGRAAEPGGGAGSSRRRRRRGARALPGARAVREARARQGVAVLPRRRRSTRSRRSSSRSSASGRRSARATSRTCSASRANTRFRSSNSSISAGSRRASANGASCARGRGGSKVMASLERSRSCLGSATRNC